MYTVATRRLEEVAGTPFLLPIAEVFLFAAIGAWAVTFVGLLRRLVGVTSREA